MIKHDYFPLIITVAVFLLVRFADAKTAGTVASVRSWPKSETVYKDRPIFSSLTAELDRIPGNYSLYLHNLTSGAVYEYNADLQHDAASLFKLFVAVAVMNRVDGGTLPLDTVLSTTYQDLEEGPGTLQFNTVGSEYSVEELLELSLKKSDNTANNMLMRALNYKYINDTTFASGNVVSVKEVSLFLDKFYKHSYTSEGSTDHLLELMEETDYDDRIHAGLHQDTVFAHKIGNAVSGSSWNDCGIVLANQNDTIVCLMSSEAAFEDFKTVAKKTGEFVEAAF